MKVESKLTIEGNSVIELCRIKKGSFDLKFYELESESENSEYKTVFIVLNNEVLKTIFIEADCGQNTGFISEFTFKDVV